MRLRLSNDVSVATQWRPALLIGNALLLAALWALLSGPTPALAQTTSFDLSSLYRNDIRALGMGNSYVAVARSEGALQYNPAGLVQAQNDIKLEGSLLVAGSSLAFIDDTVALVSGSVTQAAADDYLNTYADTTQRYSGQTYYSALAGMGALNFGLGYGSQDIFQYSLGFSSGALANDTSDDVITWDAGTLSIQYLSGGFAIRDGQMLLGATSKSFRYVTETASVTAADLVLVGLNESDLVGSTYVGTALDVGFIYRIESLARLRGQWALNVLNVGGVEITSGASTLSIPMSINFGMSISPELPLGELLLHFELEDIDSKVLVDTPGGTDQKARSVIQRSHYGVEYGLFDTAFGSHILNLRAGYNRGLVTYGAEINVFSGFRIAVAQYRDDLGNDSANSYTDPIIAFQASVGFAF
ncbi:MAG: hypothetical protein HY342_06510 [Candidatus Lambdaproteobacteria bacterium]|nr:hypothetical protein [Candidatus Lambdaproteobacteria bacterium]